MNIYINVTKYLEIVYQRPELDLIIPYQKLNDLQIVKFRIIYAHVHVF